MRSTSLFFMYYVILHSFFSFQVLYMQTWVFYSFLVLLWKKTSKTITFIEDLVKICHPWHNWHLLREGSVLEELGLLLKEKVRQRTLCQFPGNGSLNLKLTNFENYQWKYKSIISSISEWTFTFLLSWKVIFIKQAFVSFYDMVYNNRNQLGKFHELMGPWKFQCIDIWNAESSVLLNYVEPLECGVRCRKCQNFP